MSVNVLEPEKLRPALIEKVQNLGDEDLSLLQAVLVRLERDRVFRELTGEFARDRLEGKYERLDKIILEARAALRAP
ncbi:MAG TPA: hypothetical protein VIT91_09665 [Chthoniobacterales bacterium]